VNNASFSLILPLAGFLDEKVAIFTLRSPYLCICGRFRLRSLCYVISLSADLQKYFKLKILKIGTRPHCRSYANSAEEITYTLSISGTKGVCGIIRILVIATVMGVLSTGSCAPFPHPVRAPANVNTMNTVINTATICFFMISNSFPFRIYAQSPSLSRLIVILARANALSVQSIYKIIEYWFHRASK
jgi:hypothetical protein